MSYRNITIEQITTRLKELLTEINDEADGYRAISDHRSANAYRTLAEKIRALLEQIEAGETETT